MKTYTNFFSWGEKHFISFIDDYLIYAYVLRTATHTKTRNNTRSLGTRTNNTTTHTKTGNNI
jgi:hypothetical protein